MASRREFCRGGLALAALTAGPFTPTLARAAARVVETPLPPRDTALLVVVDRALPEAEAFALDAAALGYRVHAFENDVAPVWMNELEPRLRQGPLSIAGLTGAGTAFCLEILARSHRALPLARNEHTSSSAAPRFASLLAAAERADAPLPPYAHVARAAGDAPAFLTWLIATRG